MRHRDEQPPVVGLADFVDGADVRVVEGGGGLRFGGEALFGLHVHAENGRQELERDRPAEVGVGGAVDDAHAAAAEQSVDGVVPDRLPRQPVRIGGRGFRRLKGERVEPLVHLARQRLVRPQPRQHLCPQRRIVARLRHERRAHRLGPFERLFQQRVSSISWTGHGGSGKWGRGEGRIY